MRAILDTNVLVSMALAKGGPFESIWRAWRTGRFDVLSCTQLIEEVGRVIERPKLADLIDPATRKALLKDLASLTIPVELDKPLPEFRDPKDRFLLALARDGHADVLITGDAALQDLVRFSETMILSPGEFRKALQHK